MNNLSAHDHAQVRPLIAEAVNHLTAGRASDAGKCLHKALRLEAEHSDALHLLGLVEKQLGNDTKAIALIERALVFAPGHPVFHNNLGNLLLDRGNTKAAIQHYERAALSDPNYAEARYNLSIVLERVGLAEQALERYRQAVKINPNYHQAHHNLGTTLESLGQMEGALSAYRTALSVSPGYAKAHYRIALASPHTLNDRETQAMERLLPQVDPGSDAAVHLHFGLAKAYDDIDRPDDAFAQWSMGNKAKRASYDYDVGNAVQLHEQIVATFSNEFFEAWSHIGSVGSDDSAPIFVVGMPRSGTTLVEQILASHSRVSGAGELPYMSDIVRDMSPNSNSVPYPEVIVGLSDTDVWLAAEEYLRRLHLRAPGANRIVDKMPGNFLYIGMIKLMVPNARIIHCVRNPAATCFSCYTHLFNAPQRFTYDLTELGTYYRSYRRLMAHWYRVLPGYIHDFHYEKLVTDQESETRRLLDFCELEWDEACLSFHETQRPVRTASATQVRQPLYTSALTDWRRYEEHLVPLLETLGETA